MENPINDADPLNRASKVQTDFDRIARLSPDGWNHNSHYHPFFMKQIHSGGAEALEIGCGAGAFSRLLAGRFEHVRALDLSPVMLEVARERSKAFANIDYRVADAMTCNLPPGQFDCVASIATLHHLPFEAILTRMKNTLKLGGTLLVLDLFKAESLADYLVAGLGMPVNILLKLIKKGTLREPPEVRAAWKEHGRTDTYLTLSQVRKACKAILPGAHITRHLLWRYSITWKKA